jgi:hypothetical protein
VTSNPCTRNLTSKEVQRHAYIFFLFPSCLPHRLLPQITLPWIEIID